MTPPRATAGVRRRRPRLVLATVVVVAVALVAGWAVMRSRISTPGPGPTSVPTVLPSVPRASGEPPSVIVGLLTLDDLRARAARGAAGQEPEASAVRDLLAWAERAVDDTPRPKEPLRIDGTEGPFVDDTATAYGLALAWVASGDARYAAASERFVLAWVDRTKTLQNACPDGGECQTSLIVSRVAPGFVFAMAILEATEQTNPADVDRFDAWLASVIVPTASTRDNNWGDAGAFLKAAAAAYLGDAAGWQDALAQWRRQLDLVAADGHIPEEVRRGSSGLSYTQEALLYKLAVARIAELHGVDLWNATGADGGSLRRAVDFAARYQANPADWPFERRVDNPTVGPGWELAYQQWPEPTIADLLRSVRPLGADGHSAIRWTTVSNGIPFGP